MMISDDRRRYTITYFFLRKHPSKALTLKFAEHLKFLPSGGYQIKGLDPNLGLEAMRKSSLFIYLFIHMFDYFIFVYLRQKLR